MKEELENGMELAQFIYRAALNAGFDNCGIIPLDDMQKVFSCRQRTPRQRHTSKSKLFLNGLTKSIFVGIVDRSMACVMLRFKQGCA